MFLDRSVFRSPAFTMSVPAFIDISEEDQVHDAGPSGQRVRGIPGTEPVRGSALS